MTYTRTLTGQLGNVQARAPGSNIMLIGPTYRSQGKVGEIGRQCLESVQAVSRSVAESMGITYIDAMALVKSRCGGDGTGADGVHLTDKAVRAVLGTALDVALGRTYDTAFVTRPGLSLIHV